MNNLKSVNGLEIVSGQKGQHKGFGRCNESFLPLEPDTWYIQLSLTSPSQATPYGHSRTTRTSYTKTDHYYSRNHLAYYQPNVFHYQSTPWHYRWGRSTDVAAREKRAARLVEVGDLNSIPVGKISDVASNVSIAYKEDIWQNDMIFKDQVP